MKLYKGMLFHTHPKGAGNPIRKPTELLAVLSALFSTRLKVEEKMRILQEHGIVVTQESEERINTMCNLSEGINEGVYEKGLEQGRAEECENTGRKRTRVDDERARACGDVSKKYAEAAVKYAHALEKCIDAAEKYADALEIYADAAEKYADATEKRADMKRARANAAEQEA